MRVYYNEFDRFAADWLENLGRGGQIPEGTVDRRSIKDVHPDDLVGYDQAHFFAGIGGWPLALQMAGWGDRPVWTGSCPCQPFSSAGRRRGFADERHLWPVWRPLIEKLRPPVLLGEQVASTDGLIWFDRIRVDLEAMGYAVGGADLCSSCVGALDVRQRLYWVAYTELPWMEKRRRTESAGRQNGNNGRGLPGPRVPSRQEQTFKVVGSCWPRKADKKTFWEDEPTPPIVDTGIPGGVGIIRSAGNAINPVLASEFIKSVMEIL